MGEYGTGIYEGDLYYIHRNEIKNIHIIIIIK